MAPEELKAFIKMIHDFIEGQRTVVNVLETVQLRFHSTISCLGFDKLDCLREILDLCNQDCRNMDEMLGILAYEVVKALETSHWLCPPARRQQNIVVSNADLTARHIWLL